MTKNIADILKNTKIRIYTPKRDDAHPAPAIWESPSLPSWGLGVHFGEVSAFGTFKL